MRIEPTFARSAAETRAAPTSWDLIQGRGIDTDAGVPVSPHLAENLSAAFASVQLVAQTLASLPIVVYRRDGDGNRTEVPEHAVARLFAGDVNEHQSAVDFVEMQAAALLWNGNCYAEIRRDARGAPVALIPYYPSLVSVFRIPGSPRRLRYEVSDLDGGTRRLLADEMLHVRDRSDDGLVGKSRLQRAREAFGTAMATEKFAASTYRNGAALSGIVSHPETLGPDAAKTLRESMQSIYGGHGNAGRIGVLEEGATWTQMSVSPEDAQLLESRRFGVESICRLFGVPPQLIGDTSTTAYSNMVEASRHLARLTIAPWAAKWETALARSLFTESDRQTHSIEINMDELLRGDPLQRAQTWRVLREIGAVNANEVRRSEGWNRRTDPAGDEFLAPMNMAPAQEGAPKESESK
jgi:HK97 family phage portal protein